MRGKLIDAYYCHRSQQCVLNATVPPDDDSAAVQETLGIIRHIGFDGTVSPPKKIVTRRIRQRGRVFASVVSTAIDWLPWGPVAATVYQATMRTDEYPEVGFLDNVVPAVRDDALMILVVAGLSAVALVTFWYQNGRTTGFPFLLWLVLIITFGICVLVVHRWFASKKPTTVADIPAPNGLEVFA